jgi:hypothetical protein
MKLRKLFEEISSDAKLIFGLLTNHYFWFIVSWSFISMYPFVMLYVAYLLNVNPWITIILPLAPIVAVWYYIVRKRIINYVYSLLKSQKIRDTEEVIKEYLDLLEEQKRKRREKE